MAERVDPAPRPPARSRSFGPTVLLGLAGAALTAVSASRDWATAAGSAAGVHVSAAVKGSSSAPLAVALGLVALAAWGAVLVLRGRVRQAVAVLGVLAAAGVVVAALAEAGGARDDAVRAVLARGGTGDTFDSTLTGWFFVCVASAVVTVGTFLVGVVAARGWPAMGTRYDAPDPRSGRGAGGPVDAAAGPAAEQDMWKALDDGRDPTA